MVFPAVEMEVEAISKQTIRPSSPTPGNLRTFKFSLIDQTIPPNFYSPLIFFYHPAGDNHLKIDQTLTRLKNALSEALCEFYPLAGRIKDRCSVDCNDGGILFSEARVVNSTLYEFFKHPQIDLLHRFLPCPLISSEPVDTLAQVAIQVNMFAGGGIAVGMCFLHKIIDAGTMSAFLKRVSAITSGRFDEVGYSICGGAEKVLPPREPPPDLFPLNLNLLPMGRRGVTRRFVFDDASLSALKAKATSKLAPNPSRVEVVSCFIWKHAMAASKRVSGSQKSSMLTHSVDLRRRMVPPLSDNTVGNILGLKKARYNSKPGEEIELHLLVASLREATISINGKPLQREDNEDFLEMSSSQEVLETNSEQHLDTYPFHSWCNYGFNQVEFGWGKPAWVSNIGENPRPSIRNFAILLDSPSSYDIEAWVILHEREMAILETDSEFLKFASLNPSIRSL